uniref:Uncharacterized protein n=1 Tax=Seriola dumerili TaxID=41447 RepID=A0A3B4TV73_SERDU
QNPICWNKIRKQIKLRILFKAEKDRAAVTLSLAAMMAVTLSLMLAVRLSLATMLAVALSLAAMMAVALSLMLAVTLSLAAMMFVALSLAAMTAVALSLAAMNGRRIVRPFMLHLLLIRHMEGKPSAHAHLCELHYIKHNQLPLSQLLQVWRGRGGYGGGGSLFTGKIVLQGSEEVTDDWHTPRLPQHLLPLLPVHVPHVGVMFGETKDSGEE